MAKDDILVGFIGLGTMGGKMAANLQKAGYKLVVHDLTRQAASHHLNAGATWAETPRKLAEQCDVIFSSLPEPKRLAVIEGADHFFTGRLDDLQAPIEDWASTRPWELHP